MAMEVLFFIKQFRCQVEQVSHTPFFKEMTMPEWTNFPDQNSGKQESGQ
jgi:hypothetical protein